MTHSPRIRKERKEGGGYSPHSFHFCFSNQIRPIYRPWMETLHSQECWLVWAANSPSPMHALTPTIFYYCYLGHKKWFFSPKVLHKLRGFHQKGVSLKNAPLVTVLVTKLILAGTSNMTWGAWWTLLEVGPSKEDMQGNQHYWGILCIIKGRGGRSNFCRLCLYFK